MFKLESLPYDYNALEPYIDEATMRLHHDKHQQTYLDKFNSALEKYPDWFQKTPEEILTDLNKVPEEIRTAVRNNGGGFANHNLFWASLSPIKEEENLPRGEFLEAVNEKFGSLDNFRREFIDKGLNHFGSGYVWVVINHQGQLEIITLPNQDSPLSIGLTPILNVDLWEHAYYLKYNNRRAEYLEKIFNILNWPDINYRYKQAF